MPKNIIIKNAIGEDIVYENKRKILLRAEEGDERVPFTYGVATRKTVNLDFRNDDMEILAEDGELITEIHIPIPETLTPENIRKGATICGIEGEVIGGVEGDSTLIARTVKADFSEGDQVVEPGEDDVVMKKVTILKPENLRPENIPEGIEIAGVTGTRITPTLNAPTTTVTSGTQYNTIKITNPSTNGNFATGMNVYVNGELVTTLDAPSSGSYTSIIDVEQYNEVDGEQTISASFTASGFNDSEQTSVDTTMYGIGLTPTYLDDGYDYPAIKSGATYTANISRKQLDNNPMFLPPEITVLMNGEPCEYTWENDIGYGQGGFASTGYYWSTRCIDGELVVPNVTGRLDINIPCMDTPKLNPPSVSSVDGKILVTPSDYADKLTVYLDGEFYQTIEGVQYSSDGSSSCGMHNVGNILNGSVTSGNYMTQTLSFSANEETTIRLRCFHYCSANNTTNYGILSKLDTALSNSITDSSSNIQKSFSGISAAANYYVDYTIPIGEHFIMAKFRYGTTNSNYFGLFGFIPIRLFNETVPIELPDYNTHVVSVYASGHTSTGGDAIDSEPFEIECAMTPCCEVTDRVLTICGVTDAVEQIEIYINDELTDTIENDGTRSFNLIGYPYHNAESTVYFKVIGDGIEFQSNSVIADLTIPELVPHMDGFVLYADIINEATSVELYINDELMGTFEHDASSEWSIDMSQFETDNVGSNEVYIITHGIIDITSRTISAYTNVQPIYGVSGLYSSTVTLTRTDDAVGLTYTINDDGTIDSDFDDLFPWCDAKLVTDSYGNEFVQMPKMYFRVAADSSYRLTDIAVSATKGTTGNWYEVDSFCYGRYGGYVSSSKLCSMSGKTRTGSYSRANFRTYAANNGSGYHQLDLYHHTVMNFLWWIEFATKNSQNIMSGRISGSGTNGGATKVATGTTNSITTPSGYETAYAQMRYHYIEDFVGNLMEWVDGLYSYSNSTSYSDYVTSNPANFSDTTTGKSTTAYKNCGNGCIAALGWDSSKPFLCTPTTYTSNTSYNTYFCDQLYRSSSSPCIYTGAAYNANNANGRNYWFSSSSTTAYATVGARLLYAGALE